MVELPYKLSRILIHLSLGVILFWGEKKTNASHLFIICIVFPIFVCYYYDQNANRTKGMRHVQQIMEDCQKNNIAWLTRNGYHGNPLLEILGLAGYCIYDILKEKLTPNNNTINKGFRGSLIILHVAQIPVNNY